jgi:acetylornithine/succinyldiaminopimelate/putrescine aminotransferase
MNEAYIQSKSDLLFNGLERLATDYSHLIEEINGRGLLAAVVCKSTDIANQVCQLCANDGLLVVKTGRESIKIGPPLIIEPRQIRRGLTIMSLAFSEL